MQASKSKRVVGVRSEGIMGFFVVALRVNAEYRRGIHCHGRIHPDGDIGNPALIQEEMKCKNELLGSLHREGRDDDLPAFLGGGPYCLG